MNNRIRRFSTPVGFVLIDIDKVTAVQVDEKEPCYNFLLHAGSWWGVTESLGDVLRKLEWDLYDDCNECKNPYRPPEIPCPVCGKRDRGVSE